MQDSQPEVSELMAVDVPAANSSAGEEHRLPFCNSNDLPSALEEEMHDCSPLVSDQQAQPYLTIPEHTSLDEDDMEMALQLLANIDLPAECVNWQQAFPFFLRQFRIDNLLFQKPHTVRFIASDAQPLYCTVNRAQVLILLSELPLSEEGTVVVFLRRQVQALFNALPALLLAVPAQQGPSAIIDYIKTNCQNSSKGNGLNYMQLQVIGWTKGLDKLL